MPNVKGKLRPNKKLDVDRLVVRYVETREPGKAVIATETPIQRYDEERKIVVNEVLLMEGVTFRSERNQLPIVDSHNDRTVRNIFGSIRNIRVDEVNGELYGEPSFASDDDSQVIARRVTEGHITDFSITADPLETMFVPRGQSYTTKRGAVIEGPALIHTRWQPLNASICATGADVNSTVRRSYISPESRILRMDETLLAALKGHGLPEGMTDPSQIVAWVVGKLGTAPAPVVENMDMLVEEPEEETTPTPEEEKIENMDEKTEDKPADVELAVERALKADASRRKEIHAACTSVGIERAYADSLCDEGVSVDVARERILKRMATTPIGQSSENARVTQSEDDKFYAAASDGLLLRSQSSAGVRRSLITGTAAPGADDFRYQPLSRIAEQFARRMGAPVERMAPKDVALVAMGHPGTINRLRIQRHESAYHTTGSFANLMLDASNKTLLAGYEEAEYTWTVWARTAPAVADFKNINRIRFSESPDLEHVPELHDYKEGTMSDQKETYNVEKFGKLFSVSWETVVNDDLDAISRIPAMHGAAARRTQNKKVYEVLTSNPTMSDTYSLFSASHASGSNLSGAAAAPSVTTLNAAFVKMRTQKGLNTDVVLNVTPRFLIVPVAYEATAMELFSSMSYNAANNNEGVRNIYGPGGSRQLTLVSDPVLDASSSTNWYLAAANNSIDTVELAFLQGEESPVLENEWDFDKDAYRYKVRQTFGVKAIDWRGLYLNAA